MMGVFAEFERAIIREFGLASNAQKLNFDSSRRRNDDPKRVGVGATLAKKGVGIGKIARTLGIGASYVQRVIAETEAIRD